MSTLENILGNLCEKIFPISDQIYLGNKKSQIAVCTLSSMKLLEEIANSKLMNHIAVAGRLFSENKGIDSLIKNSNINDIKTIILCGKEVWGHNTGQSLLFLHKNGINSNGRIINSFSPNPILTLSSNEINKFRKQTKIINLIGETKFEKISKIICELKN